MIFPLLKRMAVRSPWIYRINSGSCNGCDVEAATAALTARFDVERLGCKYCGSPRHADILLVSGPLTLLVKDKVMRVFNEIPDPKVVMAVGLCPISNGVYRGSYCAVGSIDELIPVDINIPGCPPRPEAIMEGVLKAVAVWKDRL